MKPIPNEMRQRILDDCDDGMTDVEAAEKWKVSSSFITKLKRHVRETGSKEEKALLNFKRHDVIPLWNYTVYPK